MTSNNMTRRKIVQIACGTDNLYALADDGTLWDHMVEFENSWEQIPPLPPREDEVADAEPWQDRWTAAMAQLRQEMDRRMSIERVSLKYLSDLRRVREALSAFLKGTQAPQIVEPMAALVMINEEPMP